MISSNPPRFAPFILHDAWSPTPFKHTIAKIVTFIAIPFSMLAVFEAIVINGTKKLLNSFIQMLNPVHAYLYPAPPAVDRKDQQKSVITFLPLAPGSNQTKPGSPAKSTQASTQQIGEDVAAAVSLSPCANISVVHRLILPNTVSITHVPSANLSLADYEASITLPPSPLNADEAVEAGNACGEATESQFMPPSLHRLSSTQMAASNPDVSASRTMDKSPIVEPESTSSAASELRDIATFLSASPANTSSTFEASFSSSIAISSSVEESPSAGSGLLSPSFKSESKELTSSRSTTPSPTSSTSEPSSSVSAATFESSSALPSNSSIFSIYDAIAYSVPVAEAEIPCTPTDIATVQEIVTILGKTRTPMLAFKRSHLRNTLAPRIENLHPLKFMTSIFCHQHLNPHMAIIFDDFFKRSGFMEGLGPNLTREAKKGNLAKHLPQFAKEIGIPCESIKHFFDNQKWEELCRFIISFKK